MGQAMRYFDHQKEAVLVAHGINREGKRAVMYLSLGIKEGNESWKGVLIEECLTSLLLGMHQFII